MIWEMIVCVGITWAGCGDVHYPSYQSKQDCYEALRSMIVVSNANASAGGNGRQAIAYCRPKQAPAPVKQ
jgi:hypothetical protein